jgi:hypothetical protein
MFPVPYMTGERLEVGDDQISRPFVDQMVQASKAP